MGSTSLKLRIILLYTFTFEKSGTSQNHGSYKPTHNVIKPHIRILDFLAYPAAL